MKTKKEIFSWTTAPNALLFGMEYPLGMEIEGCSIEVPGVPDAFAQGKHTLLHMNIHVHALIYVINMKIIVIKSMIFRDV